MRSARAHPAAVQRVARDRHERCAASSSRRRSRAGTISPPATVTALRDRAVRPCARASPTRRARRRRARARHARPARPVSAARAALGARPARPRAPCRFSHSPGDRAARRVQRRVAVHRRAVQPRARPRPWKTSPASASPDISSVPDELSTPAAGPSAADEPRPAPATGGNRDSMSPSRPSQWRGRARRAPASARRRPARSASRFARVRARSRDERPRRARRAAGAPSQSCGWIQRRPWRSSSSRRTPATPRPRGWTAENDVVVKARAGAQLLGRAACAPERGGRLDDEYRAPGLRERDRRDEPVRPRADHEGGVRHDVSIPPSSRVGRSRAR